MHFRPRHWTGGAQQVSVQRRDPAVLSLMPLHHLAAESVSGTDGAGATSHVVLWVLDPGR